MHHPVDTSGARAESIAPDATLYVWPVDVDDGVTRSPKLVISGAAGDVEIHWSTHSACFSVRAPALQVRGLRDATLRVFYDGKADDAPGHGRGEWPRFGGGDTRRSDDRAVTSAMRTTGDDVVRSALLYARACGAFVKLVEASERAAAEARLAEVDAELVALAAERAALIARLAA